MSLTNKSLRHTIIAATALLASTTVSAQKVDTVSTFSLTGYVDAYYAYYSDSVGPGNFQKFPSVCPRSNNPSLNIAQLSAQYSSDNIRGTAILHFGDIAASTWAPAPYDHIMEAHIGFRIAKGVWVDGGFFRTHFGTEYLLPVENIASSVAVGTFYEPYYESGLRVNFVPNCKWDISVYLLNGYNLFVDNNNKKSLGIAATYAVCDHGNIGYSNYIGDETPEGVSTSHLRIHQNLYGNYSHNKIRLQAGIDYCIQENSDIKTGDESASMYSALATFRYQAGKRCGVYVRGEMFSDPDGWMSGIMKDKAGNLTGLKIWGGTLGMEYKPTSESYVKLESRLLSADKDQEIFMNGSDPTSTRFEIMLHAGVSFDLLRSVKTHTNDPGNDKLIEDQ